jgi:EAL domain-containing protein (putative c-di-GMP-specific phosphodiesterase class I)
LRDAETAIQQAKKMNERKKWVIFGYDDRNTAVVNLELESELHHAIENQDEIEVYYQPVVMLETGRISGFEALVRWNHPQRGLIFPDHFIPLAEAMGMIVSLDRLVIQKSFKQISLWQKKHHTFPPMSISINLSGRTVKEPDLVDFILKTKNETGMDLRGSSLEISETLLNDIPEDVSRSLAQLRKQGMHILADDFGIGYSSLNSLHLLPVDGIKIERSIIEGAIEKQSYEKMLQTIFLLAHELGLNAVVKGIETTDMLALIRGWECRYGQGFLFTKAVSYNEAEKLLEDDIKNNGLYRWSDNS